MEAVIASHLILILLIFLAFFKESVKKTIIRLTQGESCMCTDENDSKNSKHNEVEGQHSSTEIGAEELTLSMEGNQNLDEEEDETNQNCDKEQQDSSPSAQSPPVINHNEDQLEDTGISGTIIEEEPQEEIAVTCTIICYMMALLHKYQNTITVDKRKGPHELNQLVKSPVGNDSTDEQKSTEQVNEPPPIPSPTPNPPNPSSEYAKDPVSVSPPITAAGVNRAGNDSNIQVLNYQIDTQTQSVKGFQANGPEISTTTTSTASAPTLADSFSVPGSTANSELSNGDWVTNNMPLPDLPSDGAWVIPLPDNTPTPPNVTSTSAAPSDPPYCEATSWEEEIPIEATKPEPIQDQGGGGGGGASCMLVLPSIHWKALKQMKDGSEIVVLPQKPLEPQEDSSDCSSDGE